MACPDISEENPLTDGIYSNVDKMLGQQWYIFETLWNHAIPAETRIREQETADSATTTTTTPLLPLLNSLTLLRRTKKKKKVIDRAFVCIQCRWVFILLQDAEEDKTITGHKNMKESPIEGSGNCCSLFLSTDCYEASHASLSDEKFNFVCVFFFFQSLIFVAGAGNSAED
jgi:hypothetical protein